MKIFDYFKFSNEERKVFFFLLAIFIGSFTFTIIKKSYFTEEKVFNYEKIDNLLANIEKENISKKNQKKVDSKQELLDFSKLEFKDKVANKKNATFDKIDINKATKNELMSLPGIGEKTAELILELRKTKNKYTNINELLEVKGIGNKKLDKIRNHIIIK